MNEQRPKPIHPARGRRLGRNVCRALACATVVSGASMLGSGVASADVPWLAYDRNGDGLVDSLNVDFDRDGYYEAWLIQGTAGCPLLTHVEIDTNRDGTVDTFFYDTDCNGTLDVFSDPRRSQLPPELQNALKDYGEVVPRGPGQFGIGPGI